CAYFTDINLVFNPAVDLQAFNPGNYCGTDYAGFTAIELATFDTYVSSGIANATVSYFISQADAENNENILPPLFTNTSNPQIVYARVADATTGCNDIAPLEINVIPAPTVSQPSDLVICDDDQDAYYIV